MADKDCKCDYCKTKRHNNQALSPPPSSSNAKNNTTLIIMVSGKDTDTIIASIRTELQRTQNLCTSLGNDTTLTVKEE